MNEMNNQPAEHVAALPRRTATNRFGTGWGLTILSCVATLLLSATEPELLPVFTCATENELRLPAVVRSVAFSPDGKHLAAGSDDGSITLWNAATGRVLGTLAGHEGSVRSLRFSADGKELMSAGGSSARQVGELLVWDVATQSRVQTLSWDGGPVYSLALSGDGLVLAAGGAGGVVALWNTADWSCTGAYRIHASDVYSVVFDLDGARLFAAGADASIRVVQRSTGKIVEEMDVPEGGSVFALALSPDGRTLASGHVADQSIRVWNLVNGECVARHHETLGHVRALAFTPDGRQLATAAGLWTLPGDVRLLPMTGGGALTRLTGHDNVAYCLAFSPDGRVLATGSGDETVRLWQARTGTPVRTLQPADRIAR